MSRPTHALVRDLPDSFVEALAETPCAIDLPRARAQHAAYVAALAAAGLEIEALAADEAHPDCVFVEDTAVVAGGRALITRPGHPSRRGEVGPVKAALAAHLEVVELAAPARLDGGDVLRVGRTFYVGQSGRSDAAGLAGLEAAFGPLGYRVRSVAVAGALHLKCVCSSPAGGVVLLAEGAVDPAVFDAEVWPIPAEEAHAANVVAVGGRALVAAGHPRTCALLRARGLEVLEVENSELRKADGSLTCCSVLYTPRPGRAVTP